MNEEEIHGTLTIRAVVSFHPLNANRKEMIKTVTLETYSDVTRAQARGLFEDFRGANPAANIQGEWVAQAHYW